MDEPRYIILHGHFYQPPRQSPWTGLIAPELSAAPFPNWNERILSECYNANAHAHTIAGHVAYIRNNYERLNFDFGPTLHSWLEARGKAANRAIRRANDASLKEHAGHGNAIAQSYNHSILPLLDARGRDLQIAWGIDDFTFRFGVPPEGMWLPECAADDDTLLSVAQAGIKFVILGADQGRFSSTGREAGPFLWQRDNLNLAIFRFDRELAGYIAFSDVLSDGAKFAEALVGTALLLPPGAAILVATDGETFGHHKKSGAAELAHTISLLEERDDVVITSCAAHLLTHPATGRFTLDRPSAWSCAHGVERWRSNCGCRLDPNTSQEWRGPLRAAMEFVKDHVDAVYERFATPLTDRAWDALRESARLFDDPNPATLETFAIRHKVRDEAARDRLLRLFEMQRAAHAALTSCAWFFDDFGGLEGRVVLRWAARAVELAAELTPTIEHELLQRLREIHSNRRETGDAATLYLSLKTREARGRV
jgi:alpha-amylase/alpha-mannosidase (GH57 family)